MKKFCMQLAYACLLTALIPSSSLLCATPVFAKEAVSPVPTLLLSPASAEDSRIRDLMQDMARLRKELVSRDARLKQVSKDMNLLKQDRISKDKRLQELSRVSKALKEEIVSKERALQELKKEIASLKEELASKGVQIQELGQGLDILRQENDAKEIRLQELVQRTDALNQSIASLGLPVAGGAGLLVVIVSIGCLLLRRRVKRLEANLATQSEKSAKLEKSLTDELEKESAKLERISVALNAILDAIKRSPQDEPSSDFIELIMAIADRLAFMEVTLYRMDSSMKGHRQLVRSLNQIRSNLLASGFELVEMLGKPYSEGMRVIANFIDDENLKKGTQIITGITKPQINYKGKTIQAAQITVSQNI